MTSEADTGTQTGTPAGPNGPSGDAGPTPTSATRAGRAEPPDVAAARRYPEILTTAMAAEMLHVHVEYLRKMVREGRVPAHRFPEGREIRFLRDELVDWVRSQPGHDRSPSRHDGRG